VIARKHLEGDRGPSAFIPNVVGALQLLTHPERRRAVGLVASMVVNAVLTMVALAGIVPFMQLMLKPDPLAGHDILSRAVGLLGITDVTLAISVFGLALIALIAAKNVYQWWHNRLQNDFCASCETRLGTELLSRIIGAPYAWIVQQNTSILRDVVLSHAVDWSRGIVRTLLQLANDIFILLLAIVLVLVASPIAGFAMAVCATVLGVGLMRIARPRIALNAERKRRGSRLAGVTATEAIGAGRDVRMSRAGPGLISTFEHEFRAYSFSDAAGRQWQIMPRLGIEVIAFTALIGIALGALWSGVGRADVATLLALYVVVAMRAVPVISQVVSSVAVLMSALPAAAEVRAVLEAVPLTVDEQDTSTPARTDWRRLELCNVTVSYSPGAQPALTAVSLVLERGCSYGIVGPSGAGKSTLVDVLAGLLPPNTGSIRLDQTVLGGMLMRSWRSGIAYVAQSPFILDASIGDNIAFGAPDRLHDAARLAPAVEAAGLAKLVAELPEGLATRLGDRGVRLSGGQRQRVAIARALYRDADVLILDEATSALDSPTEREISQAIHALTGRVTLVIIAHRLSTVTNCDRIFVLDHGRLVAEGSHSRLLCESAHYRRLAAAQALTADA
jgi:ABC-type multidrug transport system fused ATPase/permease subunit